MAQQTNSKQVDVLAVDDAAWRVLVVGQRRTQAEAQGRPWTPYARRQARAWVAEATAALRLLIAAVRAYRDGPRWLADDEVPGLLEVIRSGRLMVARRRAALARIAPNELHDMAAELRGRGE